MKQHRRLPQPSTKTITQCIQATTAIPSCASACFKSAGPLIGCTDNSFGCLCKPSSQGQFSKLIEQCVSTACPRDSVTAVITGASSVCACFTNSPEPTATTSPPLPPPTCTDVGGRCTESPPGQTTTPVPTQPPTSCSEGMGGEGCQGSGTTSLTTVTEETLRPSPVTSCSNGTNADCTSPFPPVVTAAAATVGSSLCAVIMGIAWLVVVV